MANELTQNEFQEGHLLCARTYAIKAIIANDASPTQFTSNPRPTPTREITAPDAEYVSNCRRPIFWNVIDHDQLRKKQASSGSRQTSMRNIGGKVINTFTMVIPKDMYGPMSGSAFDKISLL